MILLFFFISARSYFTISGMLVIIEITFCLFIRSVYIVYTVLGDVSIFVAGKDEYDELACKYIFIFL